METKSEFLLLPKELQLKIYTYLSKMVIARILLTTTKLSGPMSLPIFLQLIKAGLLTPIECFSFEKKLIPVYYHLTEDERHNTDSNLRHLLELFCEGLSQNPVLLHKGKAIHALQGFLVEREMEHKINLKTQNMNYRKATIFCKPSISLDWKPKVNAATALINVLKQKPGCCLSKDDIENLSQSYFPEDNLPELVKTNLLEPLGIGNLSELDLEDNLATSKKIKGCST